MMRATIATLMALSATTIALVATPVAGAAENPCEGQRAARLRCPDLEIGRPSEIEVERYDGRLLMRATSDVKSRGIGPMELRGRRDGPRSMRVNQRIYKKGRGHITLRTEAKLHFTDVGAYFGGSYWKVHELANFELWRVGDGGGLSRRVRVGPKLNYCLRDLERTRPGQRSPRARHYPGCNQNPGQDRIALGTSVGWSDIYPADYDKQWIPVGGLRGCFAFVMKVDPRNLLFESDEHDNRSIRRVRLPYPGHPGC